MSPKIVFDFSKTKTSLAASEYLMGLYNPTEEEDSTELKDNLLKAIEGKYLKVKDANMLLQHLLTSVTVDDDVTDKIINQELRSQKDLNEAGPSGINVIPPKVASTKVDTQNKGEAQIKVKFNSENVCHFFATNKCRFGKDCRKEHPKICNKFKKAGLVKFNKNGFSEDCEYYHPRACFEAMKTKTLLTL